MVRNSVMLLKLRLKHCHKNSFFSVLNVTQQLIKDFLREKRVSDLFVQHGSRGKGAGGLQLFFSRSQNEERSGCAHLKIIQTQDVTLFTLCRFTNTLTCKYARVSVS